jgi:DNA mismatch endonuclease, patch repair protein
MAAGSDQSRSGKKQDLRQSRQPRDRPLTRSENMSRIRGKDTQPELAVRRAIWAAGLRYRLHDKRLPGKPDLVFPGRRVAVFVHGCFWHCHDGCKYFRIPKTRTEWWVAKLARNKSRDAEVRGALEAKGWRVLVIWECEVADQGLLNDFVSRVKLMPKKREFETAKQP